MELGTGTQSVSLSGLLITGNEQASAFAKAARVVSSSSCHVSVDLIESFDRSLPAHFIQSGTDTVVGSRASSDVRSSQGALSSRNIHFAFLEAVDGSLVVKETIRHAAVENLFMPSAEIIVLWFRFPETVSQAS